MALSVHEHKEVLAPNWFEFYFQFFSIENYACVIEMESGMKGVSIDGPKRARM